MFYHVLYIIQCTFIYAYKSKTVVVAELARSTYLEYAQSENEDVKLNGGNKFTMEIKAAS